MSVDHHARERLALAEETLDNIAADLYERDAPPKDDRWTTGAVLVWTTLVAAIFLALGFWIGSAPPRSMRPVEPAMHGPVEPAPAPSSTSWLGCCSTGATSR